MRGRELVSSGVTRFLPWQNRARSTNGIGGSCSAHTAARAVCYERVSFDVLAPYYGTLERIVFGSDLQRCRVACLSEIDTARRALIVGEGNGRFLCELLRMHPEIEIDCIDASQRMLQLARKGVEDQLPGQAERVRFLHQDITSWAAPEHRYDLLVTHFFLDCFPEPVLAGIIKKLARSATNDANWLLADFCLPRKGMTRLRAYSWLAA